MDFYSFIESCKEDGLSPEEAICEWEEMAHERRRRLIEDYENDPAVNYGWYQQDMFDMRRRER